VTAQQHQRGRLRSIDDFQSAARVAGGLGEGPVAALPCARRPAGGLFNALIRRYTLVPWCTVISRFDLSAPERPAPGSLGARCSGGMFRSPPRTQDLVI
jgi:hypothetical protein